jgi:hypothetical protein
MRAVIFNHTNELIRIEVKDRFEFEDTILNTLIPPRPCREYREHQPNPKGIRAFIRSESDGFEAWPYLEFAEQIQGMSCFHVMQEGRPTGFTVILE